MSAHRLVKAGGGGNLAIKQSVFLAKCSTANCTVRSGVHLSPATKVILKMMTASDITIVDVGGGP